MFMFVLLYWKILLRNESRNIYNELSFVFKGFIGIGNQYFFLFFFVVENFFVLEINYLYRSMIVLVLLLI